MRKGALLAFMVMLPFIFLQPLGAAEKDNGSVEAGLKKFPALKSLYDHCTGLKQRAAQHYEVPRAWTIDPEEAESQLLGMAVARKVVEPVTITTPSLLVRDAIERIVRYNGNHPIEPEGINLATGKGVTAVNALPRVLSMYDHDQNGLIGDEKGPDISLNAGGDRETGTFIKNILILPYLKGMGYNTIHFQPITEIGLYGRKGNQGSPFAIKDPFHIDSRLADPLFEGTVDEQYRAFIEAAHALHMKVVQEVIPRTVSIDSTILEKHPSFGYWVKEGCPKRMPDYYNAQYEYVTDSGPRRFKDRPSFDTWFQNEYKKKIYGGRYTAHDLIDVTKTDPAYTGYFMPPPEVVKREPSGKLVGYYYMRDRKGAPLKDRLDEKTRSEVFPAFCDTPFEIQPFWEDVTYLRLYDDNDGTMPMLKPLSFVTAKFFKDVEPEIEKKYRNKPVWDMIASYFAIYKNMGADAFVLDMGHALPEDLKKDIRKVLPCVWEENLGAGFDYLAVTPIVITGNVFAYCMPSYSDATEMKLYEDNPEKAVAFYRAGTRKLFKEMAVFDRSKGRMFGSPDNYNTKRIGQTPATRDLKKAPLRPGTMIPDLIEAPVDHEKARRLALLYYTLFRIMAAKDDSPFVTNPVFGTEFLATSTINVGLSTHIREAKQFYDYMTPEERKAHPHAPRLLLFSKPEKPTGEWTNRSNIIGEIVELQGALKTMKPQLAGKTHLEVADGKAPEILVLKLTEPGVAKPPLIIACNMDLEKEHGLEVPSEVMRYFLNRPGTSPEVGKKGKMALPAGWITVFTSGR
jgi:hypothetical protein